LADKPQNFDNHTRFVPAFHGFVFGILAINLLFQLARLAKVLMHGTNYLPHFIMETLVAFALLGLFFYARIFALTAQDRVIRLEMRLRLREILPADLQPRILELTPRQLIGLRFASDAEMPELVREVLAGKLTDTKAIKQRVKDWQADHLRV
jgi:hypothetical protein